MYVHRSEFDLPMKELNKKQFEVLSKAYYEGGGLIRKGRSGDYWITNAMYDQYVEKASVLDWTCVISTILVLEKRGFMNRIAPHKFQITDEGSNYLREHTPETGKGDLAVTGSIKT
jgi:hypothetical protein